MKQVRNAGQNTPQVKKWFRLIFFVGAIFLFAGCDLVPLHMRDQARYDPLEKSEFFEDGLASRPVVANTVAQGHLRIDTHFYEGRVNGELVAQFPEQVLAEDTRALLEQGQTKYNIYCAPCHSQVGDGQGMIVQRGAVQPNSFHLPSVRSQPVGYYYDVMTNGFGRMYSYASRIDPADRWAIVAYIRALQFSQNANIDEIPDLDMSDLTGE